MPQVALGLQDPVLRPPPAETQMTMTQKERTRGHLIKLHVVQFSCLGIWHIQAQESMATVCTKGWSRAIDFIHISSPLLFQGEPSQTWQPAEGGHKSSHHRGSDSDP